MWIRGSEQRSSLAAVTDPPSTGPWPPLVPPDRLTTAPYYPRLQRCSERTSEWACAQGRSSASLSSTVAWAWRPARAYPLLATKQQQSQTAKKPESRSNSTRAGSRRAQEREWHDKRPRGMSAAARLVKGVGPCNAPEGKPITRPKPSFRSFTRVVVVARVSSCDARYLSLALFTVFLLLAESGL